METRYAMKPPTSRDEVEERCEEVWNELEGDKFFYGFWLFLAARTLSQKKQMGMIPLEILQKLLRYKPGEVRKSNARKTKPVARKVGRRAA